MATDREIRALADAIRRRDEWKRQMADLQVERRGRRVLGKKKADAVIAGLKEEGPVQKPVQPVQTVDPRKDFPTKEGWLDF